MVNALWTFEWDPTEPLLRLLNQREDPYPLEHLEHPNINWLIARPGILSRDVFREGEVSRTASTTHLSKVAYATPIS